MTHPIVVAVSEGEEAREAVALGTTAARLLDAPLVLAGVVSASAGIPTPAAHSKPLRDYVANELHRQADAVPDDVPCTIHVAAAPGVLSGLEIVVEQEHAQLLVVGASHLGPLARAVRGDIGLAAAHRLGCSVLVVPAADGAGRGAPSRRIGAAWDGSDEAEAALELAVALAARGGAELTVLRAVAEGEELAVRWALDDVAARLARRVACTTQRLPGPAASALVAISAEVDLLVIGARHRVYPGSLWVGSVSTPVLRHARCPVLVVPAGARASAAA
jgi:nucleotide-binding universal stress UspA family protein